MRKKGGNIQKEEREGERERVLGCKRGEHKKKREKEEAKIVLIERWAGFHSRFSDENLFCGTQNLHKPAPKAINAVQKGRETVWRNV